MKPEREILPIGGAQFVIFLEPDACGWRAECLDMALGAWGEDRTTARANLAKSIIDIERGRATMDALIKAVGAKWKFKGFRKVRRGD